MVLAAPMIGASGSVLMDKGVILRAALIPRLEVWGVSDVWIEGEEKVPEEPPVAPEVEDTKIPLEKLFQGQSSRPPMSIIYQCLLRYRSRHGRN
jgi:hypothetical protein